MPNKLLTALFAASTLFAQSSQERTLVHERDVQTSSVWLTIPRWAGGSLLWHDPMVSDGQAIYILDRDGKRDQILFTAPGISAISISHIAGSRAGEIAITGSAFSDEGGLTAFLARISADHQHQTVTRTWPYVPKELTFDYNGNIWTIGDLKDDENTRDRVHTLRRFDPTGKLLGSATIRVKGSFSDETTYLCSSRDRVGWFAGEEYIEFGLNGSEIARYAGPAVSYWHDISGVTMNDESDVIAGRFGSGKANILILDRQTRAWTPVSLPKDYAPTWLEILGFDGAMLVTYGEMGILHRFELK